MQIDCVDFDLDGLWVTGLLGSVDAVHLNLKWCSELPDIDDLHKYWWVGIFQDGMAKSFDNNMWSEAKAFRKRRALSVETWNGNLGRSRSEGTIDVLLFMN